MNETIQLLQDVVRNARSGEEAINQLMDKVESQEMRGELDREREQYRASTFYGKMDDPAYQQALRDWLNEQTGDQ